MVISYESCQEASPGGGHPDSDPHRPPKPGHRFLLPNLPVPALWRGRDGTVSALKPRAVPLLLPHRSRLPDRHFKAGGGAGSHQQNALPAPHGGRHEHFPPPVPALQRRHLFFCRPYRIPAPAGAPHGAHAPHPVLFHPLGRRPLLRQRLFLRREESRNPVGFPAVGAAHKSRLRLYRLRPVPCSRENALHRGCGFRSHHRGIVFHAVFHSRHMAVQDLPEKRLRPPQAALLPGSLQGSAVHGPSSDGKPHCAQPPPERGVRLHSLPAEALRLRQCNRPERIRRSHRNGDALYFLPQCPDQFRGRAAASPYLRKLRPGKL